jgi:glycine oxidase
MGYPGVTKVTAAALAFHRSRLFYNAKVKTWDVLIIGGGIIGLSLSLELRKQGAAVLIVERGEPGREASWAAGGMLADSIVETPPALQPLASASAHLYPEFVRELELESGLHLDLRDHGTILFPPQENPHDPASFTRKEPNAKELLASDLSELEPALGDTNRHGFPSPALLLKERSIDPRALTAAALKAAKRRGVDFSSADPVTAVNQANGHITGVTTTKTAFHSAKVVNCAGAWSGQIALHAFPTRPVKGQMLCLLSPSRELLHHVIRTPDVYLIPRGDGRIIVGSTLEEAGFDKRVDLDTIQRLHKSAITLVPKLADAKILEDWAGLRPGTPDGLPILGPTATPGYYVATGHFRDGILLAPITAQVMAQVIAGTNCNYDLTPFSQVRFPT